MTTDYFKIWLNGLVGGGSAWSGGGVVVGVCLVPGGGCLPGRGGVDVCLVPGWGVVSAWSRGGVCLVLGGGCLPGPGGGVVSAWSQGGLPGPGGGGWSSQHALRQTPPVNRMTNRCKNITLATTSLRPVKMQWITNPLVTCSELAEVHVLQQQNVARRHCSSVFHLAAHSDYPTGFLTLHWLNQCRIWNHVFSM